MRFWPAAIGVAVALLTGGDAMREKPPDGRFAAEELVLRVAPDGGAPVRARVAKGAAYEVTVRQGGWTRVRAGEGSGAVWGWTVLDAADAGG